jgi:hypothetical protein
MMQVLERLQLQKQHHQQLPAHQLVHQLLTNLCQQK